MNEGEPRGKVLCDQCRMREGRSIRVGRRDFIRICGHCWNELPEANKNTIRKEHKGKIVFDMVKV